MQFIHADFIESVLKEPIRERGTAFVGLNLNDFLTFKKAEEYANNIKKSGNDRASKGSKDSILGRLVEEVVVYLLIEYFKENKLGYVVTNQKSESQAIETFYEKLKLVHNHLSLEKKFDADIMILNPKRDDRFYVLSVKGTTRERIGQFLSHLFMMDNEAIIAKYGKDRYTILFERDNVKLKYGFVTMDWAVNKDFVMQNKSNAHRKSVKEMEVQLVNDDHKIGGGLFVLNNLSNFNGVGNFGSLVGRITDFLK